MSRTILRRRDGVTLIELLVVVAIISILAALVVGINSFARQKTYRAKAVATMEKIRGGLEEFRINQGSYPTGSIGFITNYVRDLTSADLIDPWGRNYEYSLGPGVYQYRLWSFGPDGVSNTVDDLDTGTGIQ